MKYEANAWAKQTCDPEKWKKRRNTSKKLLDVKILRKELENWIFCFGHKIADTLSNDIYFVVLNHNTCSELREFFMDYLYQKDDRGATISFSSVSRYVSRFVKPSCMTEIKYRGRTYEVWELARGTTGN